MTKFEYEKQLSNLSSAYFAIRHSLEDKAVELLHEYFKHNPNDDKCVFDGYVYMECPYAVYAPAEHVSDCRVMSAYLKGNEIRLGLKDDTCDGEELDDCYPQDCISFDYIELCRYIINKL